MADHEAIGLMSRKVVHGGRKADLQKENRLFVWFFVPVIREKTNVDQGKVITVVALEFGFLLDCLHCESGLLEQEIDPACQTNLKSLDIAYSTLRYISFEQNTKGQ